MATLYGDVNLFGEATATAYPTSFSGAGLFNMSPLARDLMELLPSYFHLGNNNRRLMELFAMGLKDSETSIAEVRDQFFVQTATWGLKYWEQLVGLPVNERNLDYAARRTDILARLRVCNSEKCFVEGLEEIMQGTVNIIDLDPAESPYQVDLEIRSVNITHLGPASSPTAAVGGVGPLTGDYTYKVTYEFPLRTVPGYINVEPVGEGETSSGVTPVKTNEVQTISASGIISGGTFTITYSDMWDETKPPNPKTTDPLPYNATRQQVATALESLSNVYPGSVLVTGGPVQSNPIQVEFVGSESGFPQAIMTVNSNSLTGGGHLETDRVQMGTTSYADSESNTVTASNHTVVLSDVPTSPDPAMRRHIYRKKNAAPYNEYRRVGTIEDNITSVFTDDVPDEDLSEQQRVVVTGTGTFKLRFASEDTIALSAGASAGDVKAALEDLSPTQFPDVEVTVEGTTLADGLLVTFDGGDVVGLDVPMMEVVDTTGSAAGYVTFVGPQILTDSNSAFTLAFQKGLQYLFLSKPAHLRIRSLRSQAFRASISSAGEPV